MENNKGYSTVTESPDLKVTEEQIARLYHRYNYARSLAKDSEVLEVACGSGIGLGYLAEVAVKVVGIDVDSNNIDLARKCNKNDNVVIRKMDAHHLEFDDESFDLVLLYEAIYYLDEPAKFIAEARRILRKDGVLIICTVNRDWEDFHPSQFSRKYYSSSELRSLLKDEFKVVNLYGAFEIRKSGIKDNIVSLVKRMAVKYSLIPGSLQTRAYLKRIFMGKLRPMPAGIREGMAAYDAPRNINENGGNNYKILYAKAKKSR